MKVYTNQGNPLGLKLLTLLKLAKRDAEVKVVKTTDTDIKEIKVLPILELESGVQIFSTNAAAKYLLPKEENYLLVSEWAEWSLTHLGPALVCLYGKEQPKDSLNILNKHFNKIQDALNKTPFLTGETFTTADVSVWCLLTPNVVHIYIKKYPIIMKWYEKISKFPEILDALTTNSFDELNFKALEESYRFGTLLLNPAQQVTEKKAETPNDSPFHIVDSITESELNEAKISFIHIEDRNIEDPKIVLPKKGERNILITSALPYVNNVPHLGNIIGCVLSADIFARYCRLCGYNTLYISGTDEYGTATENKALAENLTPKQICDKYYEIHNTIYRWFGIGFDYFGRTTGPEQTEIVQECFLSINDAGFIDSEIVDQLLCEKCDRFLADRFVEGMCPHPGCEYEDARGDQCDKCGKLINAIELKNPRCKVCSTAPVIRNSKQLFLNLPKLEPKLKSFVEDNGNKWSHNAHIITKSWLKEGLKSRCITRDLKWGIPVPLKNYENKVFYVWFDAPFGYISITKRYTKEYKQWWQPKDDVKVELFQFMAKDNVPFHSILFPACLFALDKGYTFVSHIMATEYLNYEDGKFSKSRGIGVFGDDAQNTGIPADVWRFYLACARPEGQDSNFSWNDLALRNNSELLNNIGNFINRALVFCEKNFSSTIPPMVLTEDDLNLLVVINREIKNYRLAMEKAKMRDGIKYILLISKYGNQFLQTQQPWVLVKGTDDEKERAGTIIGLCCNLSYLLALLLFPFMPMTARTIYKQLNKDHTQINSEKSEVKMYLPAGHVIGQPLPLFSKIESTKIDELKQKYGGPQNSSEKELKTNVSDEFKTILEAEGAIKKQGDKVRELKSLGTSKSDLQPEIDILLSYKKQLATLQSNSISNNSKNITTQNSSDQIKALEQQILNQGEKVRKLKQTAGPDVWKPEVQKLLDLKSELSSLTGTPLPSAGKTKKKK